MAQAQRMDQRLMQEGRRTRGTLYFGIGLGLAADPVPFTAARAGQVRAELLPADAVLAWMDPVGPNGDRAALDEVLREAAAAGAWIGAHPDVIARMGTKDVLYATRGLGWGTDTHRYPSPAEFRRQFPARLAGSGIRVLKPSHGNGGFGVWKVTLGDGRGGSPVPGPEAMVTAQHARIRDETREELPLGHLEADGVDRQQAGAALRVAQGHAVQQDHGLRLARAQGGRERCNRADHPPVRLPWRAPFGKTATTHPIRHGGA